jgi:hypothetical protein
MDHMTELQELFEKQEDLHPDLVPYLENTKIGLALRHPLVYGIFYTPQMNAMYNKQYKAKLEYIEKSLQEKNYSSYLWMHERPYRMQKFVEIIHEVSDNEYWELLASIWIDSENLWQYHFTLGNLLNNKRPGREKMMDSTEVEFLQKLPDEFTIYRGHQGINRLGYSWSLSYFKAKWFSQRFNSKKAAVVSALVQKKDVIAVLLGRGEFEIICEPLNLQNIKTITKTRKRKDWIETALQKAKIGFKLRQSYHGLWHWEKVEKNALALAKATPGCDPLVVQLFALLHDCRRENEDHDPEHGIRAAEFVKSIKDDLEINESQLTKLIEACQNHNDGKVSSDPTIGVCWDADRLDLTRVGIIPDPNLLSTKAGKDFLWKI